MSLRFRCTLVLVAAGLTLGCVPPHDATLQKAFERDRSRFERLVGVIRSDSSFQYVSRYQSITINGSRVGHFQSGWPSHLEGIRHQESSPTGYYFIMDSGGFAGSGWEKGVALLEQPPSRTLQSLDQFFEQPGGGVAFVHLSDEWYLYAWDE